MISELGAGAFKRFSLIIPVYRNSQNIVSLLAALDSMSRRLVELFDLKLEVVFVVDGSPDDSYAQLDTALRYQSFESTLLLLSKNYGSFAAIRAGLERARGEFFAVMAADLQEPPELILEFARLLSQAKADVVVGRRAARQDPLLSRLSSDIFWMLYRRLIQPDLPPGGVDIFGGNRQVLEQLTSLDERNSSLVGLLYWIGFKRQEVPYQRLRRQAGRSAWTLKKKIQYLTDSIFNFTDLPIRILLAAGVCGLVFSILFTLIVIANKLFGIIPVPGYAATVIIVSFFGGLNSFGLGLVGGYVWRTFENTKARPNYIVASSKTFDEVQDLANREHSHGQTVLRSS